MKFKQRILNAFETQAKKETLNKLRSMSERQLQDCGISPRLLQKGVNAWPWKEQTEKLKPLRLELVPGAQQVAAKSEFIDHTAAVNMQKTQNTKTTEELQPQHDAA